jgi:signal transduction histidine kinase
MLLWSICTMPLSFIEILGNGRNISLFRAFNTTSFIISVLVLTGTFVFSMFYPIARSFTKTSKFFIVSGLVLSVFAGFPVISGNFMLQNSEVVYQPGRLGLAIGVFAAAVIVGVAINSFRAVSHLENSTLIKRRAIILLAGVGLTFVHSVFFLLILPFFVGQMTYLYVIGYAAPFYFIITTVYSLTRHNLFDVRLVVARAMAYVLSLLSVGFLYVSIVFGVFTGILGGGLLSAAQRSGYAVLSIIFGLSIAPSKRFFDRVTNRVFYQDAYDGQDLLRQLNEVLINTIDIDKLLDRSSAIIKNTIRSEFCIFGLKAERGTKRRIIGHGAHNFTEEDIAKVQSMSPRTGEKLIITDLLPIEFAELQGILRDNKVAVIVRLTNSKDLKKPGMGYIVMGDKSSGNGYSSRDIDVLSIIADEYVIAIQNTLRFEQIEQFGHTMERRVERATRELQKSNERLKALDETKDEFISMASHQLRTPLTSVKGYLSMVLEGDAGEISQTQKTMLDQAYVSSQRMVYLIADLLNVSRLRTGKFVIDAAPTDLAKVISQEISQLNVTLENHNLKMVFEPPADVPLLNLDETKIRQVIMNFIDNAIYYTPSGGVITIGLTQTAKSVEFTVTDNGMGVPKAEQHQLFTKFFRAHNARKARPDGTGLGLFMAKKVIIAQHGSVVFRSREGKGSTFGFIFPKSINSDTQV